MKKRIAAPDCQTPPNPQDHWIDIEEQALVELSSEDRDHPIECALVPGSGTGWCADAPGPQTIRLLFHEPQTIRRMLLGFQEKARTRTQEFVLRWSSDQGVTYRDIVRQQWNFSTSGNTAETEDYRVNLSGVTALELHIIPDISGGDAKASLAQWRIA